MTPALFPLDTPTRARSVLVVEDNDNLRDLLVTVLGMEDDFHVCHGVRTAEEALEVLSHTTPDLVLADLFLPGMDGFALIARIKKDRPDVCCVALSGYKEKDFVHIALDAGASGYIVKTCPDELISGLRQALTGQIFLSHALEPSEAS